MTRVLAMRLVTASSWIVRGSLSVARESSFANLVRSCFRLSAHGHYCCLLLVGPAGKKNNIGALCVPVPGSSLSA